ncbi:Phage-related protein [Orenia metallireducens]|uniref:Phage-related protein n=1 Tax=Orenia metallireducens TaxID=1413210 RepID=A0A285G7R5_9FIRM|nr:phage tail domain-containing protein [Orenia metallireducens]SNY19438.1 Phage-related protein [Orenia metallireducens]
MIKLVNSKGEEMLLNPTFSFDEIESSKSIKSQEIANSDGEEYQGSKYNSRSFEIKGAMINTTNSEQLRKDVDELYGFLQYDPIKIYRNKDIDKYILGYINSDSKNWHPLDKWVKLEFEFLAVDPFFYSSGETRGEAVNNILHSFQVVNDGNIEIYPSISLTFNSGTTTDPVVENLENGNIIILNGDFRAGDEVIIDCERLTVEKNGSNTLNIVNDNFLLDSFKLQSGRNDIEFRCENSADLSLIFSFKNKWI